MARSVGELLGECLADLGVATAWGASIPGLAHRGAHGDELDALFADAEGRIGPVPGAALLADGSELHLSTQPGGDRFRFTVTDPAELPEAIAMWHLHGFPATYDITLGFELDQPAPPDAGPIGADRARQVPVLDPTLADETVVIVAGPGVVRADVIDALAAAATRAACGVVNTWGAKGVFRWDDPRHHGTFGLQANDLPLSGITNADIVVTTGLDPRELPPGGVGDGLVLDVHPSELGALFHLWPEPTRPLPPPPELYRQLQIALASRYRSNALPLAPPRATAEVAAALPPGGIVVADPGDAGFWIARTLPTTQPGSVIVPATVAPGFAAAAGYVAARRGQFALAVTAGPVDGVSQLVMDQATADGLDLRVVVWGDTDDFVDVDDHARRLSELVASSGVQTLDVAVDWRLLTVLTEIAGPVTAWT